MFLQKQFGSSIHIRPKLFPNFANIIEVGPRDGLQNEKKILSVIQKQEFINSLQYKCNFKHIEIGSFVNPKAVPTMKDSVHLSKILNKPNSNDVLYSVLVPNKKGMEDVINNPNVDEIVLFVSVSDTFNKHNINCTLDEAFEKFKVIIEDAKRYNKKIRGSISCCFGCPYEGQIEVSKVIDVIRRYNDLDVDLIDIADTIGVGTPQQCLSILEEAKKIVPISKLTGHFHDTNNNAIKNVEMCLKLGMTTFHSSIAGIGGCPYSPKRVGNLDTTKLLEFLYTKDIKTGINLEEVKTTSKWIKDIL